MPVDAITVAVTITANKVISTAIDPLIPIVREKIVDFFKDVQRAIDKESDSDISKELSLIKIAEDIYGN